jgi:nucleoside-diphosphate-sugar epimerase
VSLLQGAKAYGAHRHAVAVPLREDRPRDDHANFYWLHEDQLRLRAAQAGFGWTIWRPQVLLGGVVGAAMNPVTAIGAYAALCRELGRPFTYPGQGTGLMEMVDANLLAEAFAWATVEPLAANQTFNVTNGDVMVLSHAWPDLAASLGLATDGDPPESLAAFFAENASVAAWARLAERHRLAEPSLSALLGQSHHYMDLLLGARIAAKAVPVLLSTIKLRQAGFAACRDSAASLQHWLKRMSELKLLPPLFRPDLP